jgi:hypothetical protein
VYVRAREWVRDSFPALVGGQADINLFECTIRVVGGLLAVHELSGDPVFLDGAELAMRAMVEAGAFASPTGLPYGTLYLAPRVRVGGGTEGGGTEDGAPPAAVSSNYVVAPDTEIPEFSGTGVRTGSGHAYNPSWAGGSSSISEVSTLQLELAALTRRTHVWAYHEAGRKAMLHLAALSPSNGLYPIMVDPNSGSMKDVVITLGARGDSLYEYLLKQWIYLGGWTYETRRAKAMAAVAVEMAMPFYERERACEEARGSAEGQEGQEGEGEGGRSAPVVAAPPPPDPEFLRRIEVLATSMLAVMGSAVDDDPRWLLRMYNRAVCGIQDRLVQRSSPSNFTFVAEQSHSSQTMPGQDPALIPKMDHLVCFLPGVLALGAARDAGHEMMALEREVTIRTLALTDALDAWQERTGRTLFADPPAVEAAGGNEEEEGANGAAAAATATAAVASTEWGQGEAGPPPPPPSSEGEGEEATSSSSTARGGPVNVAISVHVPPRYSSPSAMAFLQKMLGAVERWLTPKGLKGLPAEVMGAQSFLEQMQHGGGPNNDGAGPRLPCPPPRRANARADAAAAENDGGGSGRDGDATEPAGGSETGATADDGSSTPPPTTTFPDPDFDPFCSLRDPAAARQTLEETAAALAETCRAMYTRTPTGLAPEIITFTPGRDFEPNADARHCLLRPETLESLFVLQNVRDEKAKSMAAAGLEDAARTPYREWAWEIFDSIEQHARVRAGGYASVKDVRPSEILGPALPSLGRANLDDKMESFHLAETLKYLYLLLTPGAGDMGGQGGGQEADGVGEGAGRGDGAGLPPWQGILPLNRFVFNTEAHPLEIPDAGAEPPSSWAPHS